MLNGLFYFSLLLTLALAVYLIWFTGVLNIALEGTFLWTVFSAFFALQAGYSLPLTLLFTFLSSVLCLGFFYILHFYVKINENFVGILINILVVSLLDLINQLCFKRQGILLFLNPAGDLIFFRWASVVLFLTLFALVSFVLFKTPFGLNLRMARSPAIWKQERGICVEKDRLFLWAGASILITLSSTALLVSLNAYTVGLGSGMGWLGLFALLLGFFRLRGIVFASAFLAFSFIASYWVQEQVGSYFSRALPYLSSFLAYVILSWWEAIKFRKSNPYKFS